MCIRDRSLCAGVDAHIGFAHIADFALDGSCEKVYHNIVPDLIINGLFGSSVCLLYTSLNGWCAFPKQKHDSLGFCVSEHYPKVLAI